MLTLWNACGPYVLVCVSVRRGSPLMLQDSVRGLRISGWSAYSQRVNIYLQCKRRTFRYSALLRFTNWTSICSSLVSEWAKRSLLVLHALWLSSPPRQHSHRLCLCLFFTTTAFSPFLQDICSHVELLLLPFSILAQTRFQVYLWCLW